MQQKEKISILKALIEKSVYIKISKFNMIINIKNRNSRMCKNEKANQKMNQLDFYEYVI